MGAQLLQTPLQPAACKHCGLSLSQSNSLWRALCMRAPTGCLTCSPASSSSRDSSSRSGKVRRPAACMRPARVGCTLSLLLLCGVFTRCSAAYGSCHVQANRAAVPHALTTINGVLESANVSLAFCTNSVFRTIPAGAHACSEPHHLVMLHRMHRGTAGMMGAPRSQPCWAP